jgi:hypothetical protein
MKKGRKERELEKEKQNEKERKETKRRNQKDTIIIATTKLTQENRHFLPRF